MPKMTDLMRPLHGDGSPRRVRIRLFSIAGIAQALERDMGLRLISLALAIGLWIFVNAGQHGALQSFQVPVSYRDLPLGFIITNPHPDFIRVQVSGPRTLLSIIDPTHLTLRLDLTAVGIGQASFKIGPDAFPVPRHTEITSILPSQIVLDIDKIISREIPVRLVLTGAVASGYRIASSELTPANIVIRGPSRQVARIEELETEPLSVAAITSDLSRKVDLMAPSSAVRLEAGAVTAKVTVVPVIVDKGFHDLPISVRDSGQKYRIDPHHLNLVLRGPLLTLGKIDLKDAAYVEAEGLSPGSYTLPVQINLPDGVALVRQSPDQVRVRIYRERQAPNG